jgi:leucyl-tRNA synthetase
VQQAPNFAGYGGYPISIRTAHMRGAWVMLGNEAGTLSHAAYPKFIPSYLVEDDFAYPISINGKTRMNLSIALTMEPKDVEGFVLQNADVQKYLDGKTPKKVIVVKGRIVNIVI